MNKTTNLPSYFRLTRTSVAIWLACSSIANASINFTGVAAGDATSKSISVWTRAVDDAAPAAANLKLEISHKSNFSKIHTSATLTTDPTKDYTAKIDIDQLRPATTYFYRFVGQNGEISNIGKFKTAPEANEDASVKFAFSGDNDGLMRPYALAATIQAQDLDFYINLGDTIYENASNVAGDNGASWLNSPSVTLSGSSASLNGLPVAGTTFATQAQLRADYSKKYRENFLPVNTGGQNSLQILYASQGNYTTYDNHELGNRQYINGGAPAGGSVGGPLGTDMPTGRGVDARANGAGNPGNINDANKSASDFINRSLGFLTLQDTFLSYHPIANHGTISAPSDQRTDGTKKLYFAQQWGKNVIYVNVDDRSYRDIRLKTLPSSGSTADDTSAPRANNPDRTILGKTQLGWLKQTLLEAQTKGTKWKFISLSNPIDQIGPIAGAFPVDQPAAGCNVNHICNSSGNINYGPVNSDGGKSWLGGYRAERNDLLKFIADNGITNVVFMATDDHQNRINELTYSPTGDTENQASYVKVPYTISIVAGPLGATGPDLFLNHDYNSIKTIADSFFVAQSAAGIEPFGLQGYPGLSNVTRENDPNASVTPSIVDFYSPDTFNYNTFHVSEDGDTLTVRSIGITANAQNKALEYDPLNNPAREIFSFKLKAFEPKDEDEEGEEK